MSGWRPAHRTALLLLLYACSACTLAPTEREREAQAAAVQRWQVCVERYRRQRHPPPPAEQVCEGHRRDIVDHYPRHLAGRLERILVDRTRERLSPAAIQETSLEQIRYYRHR